ncbi:MAG: dipeptidase [Syntrophomonadaceae bacterium]|jgi:membrane dipeptidase
MKIVDLHCDTLSALVDKNESLLTNSGQYDINRARQGHIGWQFFALFAMPKDAHWVLRNILKQVDKFYDEIENNAAYLYHLKRYQDAIKPENSNKIGCLLHLEGAEAIGTDLEMVSLFYRLGLRSMALTWNNRNQLADGISEGDSNGGLSLKGRQVLKEMSRLGIILDLAHISEAGYYDALQYYDKPIMVTHANARKLCNHRRNLTDDQLKALAQHGGVIGITQVSEFVKESGATLNDLLDHVVYVTDLIGVEHVAFGSDFDGSDSMVIDDVRGYSILSESLQSRGYNNREIEMILNGNALRIIKEVLK